MSLNLTEQTDPPGVRLSIKAVPGARRDRIAGELGGALKVAVTAPAEGGKANRAIVALLAARLGIPAGRITLVRGATNPRKEVFVAGVSVARVRAALG